MHKTRTNTKKKTETKPVTDRVRRFFADLGPGLITGAADDDPSGISTYSVTGASFGYMPLWTALFSFPLMAAVQLMCARLGLVTGRGLAGVVRRYYPRWVLWSACALLIVANVFNIGADLGGMAEATEMMTGIKSYYWTPLYTLLIISLLFFSSYRHIARIFKWLTMVLFAYIAAAFLARPDWHAVLSATFVPRVEWSSAFLATFVGILGTTISPYLFFWQASQEVEDDRAQGKRTVKQREGATFKELRVARTDVFTGMFFSNLVMYFIILTTAATLHAHGQTNIQTAREAAEALRPLAGSGAYLLFTLGLIGTGMLGCSRARRLCRLCSGGSGGVARDTGRPTAIITQVLRVDRGCDAVRSGVGFCRLQRGEDALLFGSAQWGAGTAFDCPGSTADEQIQNNGHSGQFAPAALFRMGNGGDHDRRSRRDVCDHV